MYIIYGITENIATKNFKRFYITLKYQHKRVYGFKM